MSRIAIVVAVLFILGCRREADMYDATYGFKNSTSNDVKIKRYQTKAESIATETNVNIIKEGEELLGDMVTNESERAEGSQRPSLQSDSLVFIFNSEKSLSYTLKGDKGEFDLSESDFTEVQEGFYIYEITDKDVALAYDCEGGCD